MTKSLQECLNKLKVKYKEGEEFKADDISYGMFKRATYNLNRLVELGYLKRRVHFDERTLKVFSFYAII